LAAVLGEESNEFAHDTEASRVNHPAVITSLGDKTGVAEPVEMKLEMTWGEAEVVGDLAGRHAPRSSLYQQAENFESTVLCKRGKRNHGVGRFHGNLLRQTDGSGPGGVNHRGQAKYAQHP
jgi:hypothetical protein